MARGSARLNQFLRGQIGGGEDRLGGLARSGRDAAGVLRLGHVPRGRRRVGAWSRSCCSPGAGTSLTRGVPAVGELVPFTPAPIDLLREWASGWRTAGLGSESPNPTLFGAVGGARRRCSAGRWACCAPSLTSA